MQHEMLKLFTARHYINPFYNSNTEPPLKWCILLTRYDRHHIKLTGGSLGPNLSLVVVVCGALEWLLTSLPVRRSGGPGDAPGPIYRISGSVLKQNRSGPSDLLLSFASAKTVSALCSMSCSCLDQNDPNKVTCHWLQHHIRCAE